MLILGAALFLQPCLQQFVHKVTEILAPAEQNVLG
jgi:hypothetical protein